MPHIHFLTCFDRAPIIPAMRTERVNLEQVTNQLADLIAFASEGGEVIIVQDGKPLARLIGATDYSAYKSFTPSQTEFSSDEQSLAWDAAGWEDWRKP